MRTINNITVGSDPELFIINEKTGKVVSSIGLIPGVKNEPWVGDDMPKGFGLETDNILAEFNIPPVTNCESFVNNIEYMKSYIDRFVKDKNPDLGIKCSASEIVDSDQLNSKEAKLFGCDPDYNAYTQSENPRPKGKNTNLRSAGFHIHIGYAENNVESSLKLIKYLDMYLGVPSCLMDTDTRRRKLYGKAGSFRLTSYGLEYRTLSSAMMGSTEKLKFVYQAVNNAILAYNHNFMFMEYSLVMEAIDRGNTELAKKLVDEYNLIPTDSKPILISPFYRNSRYVIQGRPSSFVTTTMASSPTEALNDDANLGAEPRTTARPVEISTEDRERIYRAMQNLNINS